MAWNLGPRVVFRAGLLEATKAKRCSVSEMKLSISPTSVVTLAASSALGRPEAFWRAISRASLVWSWMSGSWLMR